MNYIMLHTFQLIPTGSTWHSRTNSGMQDAGCGTPQGGGSLPFDCDAALNNFFRAAWPAGVVLLVRCVVADLLQTCGSVVPVVPFVVEAWSPEKKHWCCTKQGKGCEGESPPSVDAGYGMVWKHVKAAGGLPLRHAECYDVL